MRLLSSAAILVTYRARQEFHQASRELKSSVQFETEKLASAADGGAPPKSNWHAKAALGLNCTRQARSRSAVGLDWHSELAGSARGSDKFERWQLSESQQYSQQTTATTLAKLTSNRANETNAEIQGKYFNLLLPLLLLSVQRVVSECR